MKNKGFTLIELLVVVAIISLLSSVVLASLDEARMRARDAKRLQDMHAIRTALEMYRSDKGYYPKAGYCDWNTNCYTYSYHSTWTVLRQELKDYIDLPVDPVNEPKKGSPFYDGYYSYAYGNVGRKNYTQNKNYWNRENYDLLTQFENRDHPLKCINHIYNFYFIAGPWPLCGPGAQQTYTDYSYQASIF